MSVSLSVLLSGHVERFNVSRKRDYVLEYFCLLLSGGPIVFQLKFACWALFHHVVALRLISIYLIAIAWLSGFLAVWLSG